MISAGSAEGDLIFPEAQEIVCGAREFAVARHGRLHHKSLIHFTVEYGFGGARQKEVFLWFSFWKFQDWMFE